MDTHGLNVCNYLNTRILNYVVVAVTQANTAVRQIINFWWVIHGWIIRFTITELINLLFFWFWYFQTTLLTIWYIYCVSFISLWFLYASRIHLVLDSTHSQSHSSFSLHSCLPAFELSFSITCTLLRTPTPVQFSSSLLLALRALTLSRAFPFARLLPHQERVTLFNMEKKVLSLGEHVLVHLHPSAAPGVACRLPEQRPISFWLYLKSVNCRGCDIQMVGELVKNYPNI